MGELQHAHADGGAEGLDFPAVHWVTSGMVCSYYGHFTSMRVEDGTGAHPEALHRPCAADRLDRLVLVGLGQVAGRSWGGLAALTVRPSSTTGRTGAQAARALFGEGSGSA